MENLLVVTASRTNDPSERSRNGAMACIVQSSGQEVISKSSTGSPSKLTVPLTRAAGTN